MRGSGSEPGVIPLAVQDLFNTIYQVAISITVSFLFVCLMSKAAVPGNSVNLIALLDRGIGLKHQIIKANWQNGDTPVILGTFAEKKINIVRIVRLHWFLSIMLVSCESRLSECQMITLLSALPQAMFVFFLKLVLTFA